MDRFTCIFFPCNGKSIFDLNSTPGRFTSFPTSTRIEIFQSGWLVIFIIFILKKRVGYILNFDISLWTVKNANLKKKNSGEQRFPLLRLKWVLLKLFSRELSWAQHLKLAMYIHTIFCRYLQDEKILLPFYYYNANNLWN